jgi:S-adenosylmethionine synthetase
MNSNYLFTSESVTEGHPDKICDQISDAILDAIIKDDPNSRVAVECLTKTGFVVVAGEVTTKTYVDIQKIARDTILEIGYNKPEYGFEGSTCGVLVAISEQSSDISQGVNENQGLHKEQGAGDQGCLKKGTLVRIEKGFVPIEDVKKGDKVATIKGFKKVINAQCTGMKKVVEIKMSNGTSLECTPDHKILCFNKKQETYWKEAGKLEKGDYICKLKQSFAGSKKNLVSCVNRKQFFSKFNHKIYGPERLVLDEKIGYIIGELIGDGNINKPGTMEIAFGNNRDHVEKIKKILDEKFPNQWKFIDNNGSLNLKIDSILVRRHFENFGLSYSKSPHKKTPKSILISPPNVIKYYSKGLFDSDGTIVSKTGRTGNNIRIRLCSSSLTLLKETQLLLNEFGIKSSILLNRPKGTVVGNDNRYKSNYDNYVLNLVGFYSYHNFAKNIGFLDQKKLKRLKEYVKNNSIKPSNSRGLHLIPHPHKDELIDENKLGKNLPFAISTFESMKSKGISEVYDLEVKDVNMFSGNGIFVHNSMFGYATNETAEYMPLPIVLAHKLTRRLSQARKSKEIEYLRPDGKSQVTVEYGDGLPKRVDSVVLSTQHSPDVDQETIQKDMIDKIIKPICKDFIDENTRYFINPTGRFVTGGPVGDAGLTGRKIIVDTYGGVGSHGGGCYSGKDPSKVDRSASYYARYVAKNIVAAELADKCEVQVAYAIGVADPVSILINTFDTNKIPEEKIVELVKKHFDFRPKSIIEQLDLQRPIYKKTACYGHFGRNEPEFTWERIDRADILREEGKSI